MGNQSSKTLDEYNQFTLEEFYKQETPRKMTIHILSNKKADCILFAEFLTGQKYPSSSDQLLEKNIKDKLNLYSFMNYKIYDSEKIIMKKIREKSKILVDDPQADIFSEVIIVLDNEKIDEQIKNIKKEINDEPINDKGVVLSMKPNLTPFLIFISPNNHLDLTELIRSKTFQYKVNLDDILNFKKNIEKNKDEIKDKKEGEIKEDPKTKEISALIRKINVLFSYYNELGDVFSFKNSLKQDVLIKLENDLNIAVYINILFLGKSGTGKSSLINLLLDEKKSIEGGTGLSTTTKNIIVYKKGDIPLRFYDVKGIENEKTVENYFQILEKYNGKNSENLDNINAIFYCIQYTTGTVAEQMVDKIFEQLIEYEIPILFIITHCPFNPYIENANPRIQRTRKSCISTIENAIKSKIKDKFKEIKKEKEFDDFIKRFVRFYYVNLAREYTQENELPIFGIDKIMSFFQESVSKEEWNNLDVNCYLCDEKNCKKCCENNPFLRNYTDFEKINTRNKKEAKEYLKGLQAGAFFSGWIPALDIGMEYYYRKIFKEKLKFLYGFDYEQAQNAIGKKTEEAKENKKDEKTTPIEIDSERMTLLKKEIEKKNANEKNMENELEKEIDEKICNTGRNTGAGVRGAFEIGSVIIKALPEAGTLAADASTVSLRLAVSTGLKTVSWILLPITVLASGSWSCYNISKDCENILEIFDKAFTPLRFDTLLTYSYMFQKAISYLEYIGKKIIDDDKEENEH